MIWCFPLYYSHYSEPTMHGWRDMALFLDVLTPRIAKPFPPTKLPASQHRSLYGVRIKKACAEKINRSKV